MPCGKSAQVGAVEKYGFVDIEEVHHGRSTLVMAKSEKVTEFVNRNPECLLRSQAQRGVESNPALEIRLIRELRAGACAVAGFAREKLSASINYLDRTIARVYLVPPDFEHRTPEIQSARELVRQYRIRSQKAHAQVNRT